MITVINAIANDSLVYEEHAIPFSNAAKIVSLGWVRSSTDFVGNDEYRLLITPLPTRLFTVLKASELIGKINDFTVTVPLSY